VKTLVLTSFALLAFAGNSVLCRIALGEGKIDAAGFTSIRLLAGAITLVLLFLVSSKQSGTFRQVIKPQIRQFKGAVLLFVYAIAFSYAYLQLDTGTGALVLFGAVQLTLMFSSFLAGNRPSWLEWFGVILSFSGLVYLLLPAWGTPSLLGFMLMFISGLAWGLYTLTGKGSKNPLLETSRNFFWCLPLIVVLSLFTFQSNLWTKQGLFLAVISGALTSGVGYAIWYAVLPKLTTTQAGVLQLLVPVLAAFGGVLFVAEVLSLRLVVSTVLVLSGIYLVIVATKLNNKL
jgi:drug/metabolite transporter (DMT)-like permease